MRRLSLCFLLLMIGCYPVEHVGPNVVCGYQASPEKPHPQKFCFEYTEPVIIPEPITCEDGYYEYNPELMEWCTGII